MSEDSVLIKTYKAITQSNSSVGFSKKTGLEIIKLVEELKPFSMSVEDSNKLSLETELLIRFIKEDESRKALNRFNKTSYSGFSNVGLNEDGSFSLNRVFAGNKIRRIILLKQKHNYLNQNRTSLVRIGGDESGTRVFNDWISEDKISEYVFRLGAVDPEDLSNAQRKGFEDFKQDFSRDELHKAYLKKIKEIHPDLRINERSVAEEEAKPITGAWTEIKKKLKEQGTGEIHVLYRLKTKEEKKNSIRFDDPDFKLIKESEENKIKALKTLESFLEQLVNLVKHVLTYYEDVNPEDFVTAGIKRRFIGEKGDDSFFGRRVSNLWEVLKVIKRRFKRGYHRDAKSIQSEVKDFLEGKLNKKDRKFKRMLKLLNSLIKDFDLNKLGGLGLFKDFSLENPKTMEGIFKSLYFIIDGTGFSNQKLGKNPRTSGSILWILQRIKALLTLELGLNGEQKKELELLTDLFEKRTTIRDFTEGIEEKTIFQNNDWVDNLLDLFKNKLEQGFTAYEIESFNLRVSDFGRSPNFERNKIRVKNFEDLFLSLQYYFKEMNKIVQTRTLKLDDVKKQWSKTIGRITDFIDFLEKMKNVLSQGIDELLNERNKLFSEYESSTIIRIIAREQILEKYFQNLLNETLVDLYGNEGLFVEYFSRENSVISEILNLLEITQLDEDGVYVGIVNRIKEMINGAQDLIMIEIKRT